MSIYVNICQYMSIYVNIFHVCQHSNIFCGTSASLQLFGFQRHNASILETDALQPPQRAVRHGTKEYLRQEMERKTKTLQRTDMNLLGFRELGFAPLASAQSKFTSSNLYQVRTNSTARYSKHPQNLQLLHEQQKPMKHVFISTGPWWSVFESVLGPLFLVSEVPMCSEVKEKGLRQERGTDGHGGTAGLFFLFSFLMFLSVETQAPVASAQTWGQVPCCKGRKRQQWTKLNTVWT